MKKKYIRPVSRLYAINLAENIASSGITGGGDGISGVTDIDGHSSILFTYSGDNCRAYYSNNFEAKVTVVNGTFTEYYHELDSYVHNNPTDIGFLIMYHSCYRHQ